MLLEGRVRNSAFTALPFERWPARDQVLWVRGTAVGDPLEEPGTGATWRPATRTIVISGYAIALGWLKKHGLLDGTLAPHLRWTPERLRSYIADLKARVRPTTVRERIVKLERALAVLAPTSDRSMFRAAIASLVAVSDRSRKRQRLQDPARLVALGVQLMREADEGKHASARKNACYYRTGLQVALLAMRPLRMRNFSSITIGEHLVHVGSGWQLRFEGRETKNHRPLESPFPEELCSSLERYLAVYRPLLAGDRYFGDRLWVGYRFGPQSAHTLQLSIVRVTQVAFGAPINPHLFRDCAATSIAIHDPQSVRMAASILGHRSFGTTEKFYNMANCIDAGRSYGDVVKARRSAVKQRRRR